MLLTRMVWDFDPTAKRWWFPKREDYPEELLRELDSQFAEFYKDALSGATAPNMTTLTTAPMAWGTCTGAYKREIEGKEISISIAKSTPHPHTTASQYCCYPLLKRHCGLNYQITCQVLLSTRIQSIVTTMFLFLDCPTISATPST